MKIPTEILEKAKEGGWQLHPRGFYADHSPYVLDATFWQALGRVIGWLRCVLRHVDHTWECEEYITQALGFYGLILTNQDTTEFWREILTPRS